LDTVKKIGIGVGLGILGLFMFFYVAGTMLIQQEEQELRNMSIGELQELSVIWNRDDSLRNPEKYEGKIIHLDGEIQRVQALGGDHYSLTVRPLDGLGITFVDYTGSRVLSGDAISVYGVFERVVNVKSMLADVTNPYPLVKAIRLTCTSC